MQTVFSYMFNVCHQTYRGSFVFPGQGYMQSFNFWTSARQQENSATNAFRQETAGLHQLAQP